jgi:primary-amine oxidase
LFEQPAGYMAWRHDAGSVVESRKLRELVLRTVGVFSNYDYAFDWIFQQDGRIRVRVGATGMDNVMSVKNPTAAEDATGESSRYGRFIVENTVGVDHDHFFSFRLHFDLGDSEQFCERQAAREANTTGAIIARRLTRRCGN